MARTLLLLLLLAACAPPPDAPPPPSPSPTEDGAALFRQAEDLLLEVLRGEAGEEALARIEETLLQVERSKPLRDAAPAFLPRAYLRYLASRTRRQEPHEGVRPIDPAEEVMYRFLFENPERTPESFIVGNREEPGRMLHAQISGDAFTDTRASEYRALLDDLGPLQGLTVADIGGGLGYLAWLLAREVGPEGKVLLPELDPSVFEFVRFAGTQPGFEDLARVELVPVASGSDPGLPRPVDLVTLSRVHPLEEGEWEPWGRAFLSAIRERYLEPDGRLALMETFPETPLELAEARLQELGYEKIRSRRFFEDRGYILIFGPGEPSRPERR